jgi:Ca2+:H+ antiporter
VVAVILIGTYALGLLFSYKTHKDIFNPVREAHAKAEWSTGLAVTVLLGATALVAIIAEIVVGEAEGLVKGGGIGLSEIFLGVIVIAIIGNAAEHATAILFAWKNDLTLSVEIAASSSTQVALFLTPLIVLAALVITPGVPLTLVFPPMLIGALVFAVVVVNMIVADGEANWFEGVQLLSVYAILAAFLYYVH